MRILLIFNDFLRPNNDILLEHSACLSKFQASSEEQNMKSL